MKKKLLITVLSALVFTACFSQELPYGACGIVNVYDAAGNRTKRVYFCNNGQDYPSRQGLQENSNEVSKELQYVDALFPNPTTGKIVITFTKSLRNATIIISDNNGKNIYSTKANGNLLELNLFNYAAGVYYIRIGENGKSIIKKVVKQ